MKDFLFIQTEPGEHLESWPNIFKQTQITNETYAYIMSTLQFLHQDRAYVCHKKITVIKMRHHKTLHKGLGKRMFERLIMWIMELTFHVDACKYQCLKFFAWRILAMF